MVQMMIKRMIMCLLMVSLVVVQSVNTHAANRLHLTDYDGVVTQVNLPVLRIVSLSSALTEILWALGSGDKVVGVDANSRLFPKMDSLPVVGNNSSAPQLEAVLQLKPDVIFADTMLTEDARKKFALFGIPVIVERTSDPTRLDQTVRNVAAVVEKVERGEEILAFIHKYQNLISERVKDLREEERTRVYWERSTPYKTGSAESSVHLRIRQTGGTNICQDGVGKYPVVSAEYVWQQNPEVIIKMTSRGDSREVMRSEHEELMNRVGLKNTSAVKDKRVYIISWEIHNGLRSIIGDLYYAKWSYPDRFQDLHPDEVHHEMNELFFQLGQFNDVVYH